jgi:molecular chaperone DnaK
MMSANPLGPAVGIDLGTTFSVVAHLDADGRPVTLPNADGDLTTPSVVFLDRTGAVVGKEALKAVEFNADRVAQFPKRDMGRDLFHEPVRGERWPPEVLQALVLRKLKQDAELILGPLGDAVITVPAYFNEPRRKATQDAGRMAGWEVLDILNEPTAAAIAYGVRQGFLAPHTGSAARETILVYDLGGGTFDVTLMRIEGNRFTALATAGDVELGGIDWDRRIVDFMAEKFQEQHGVDPRQDHGLFHRMRLVAEEAKRSLSSRQETILQFQDEGRRLRTPFTRQQFESLTGELVDRTLLTLRRLMREARVSYADLTRLLVVGGASRMPMITAALAQESGHRIDRAVSADEAVAHGAAIYAGYLRHRDSAERQLVVQNVNSHDLGVLGVEPATGLRRRKVMIPRNTALPAKKTCRFATHKPQQTSVVVNVVEGGDASGNGATSIGRCLVSELPPDLPGNTPVDVTFRYAENGRLDVRAVLPSVQKGATLTIERATGMPSDRVAAWAACVAAGLPDGCRRPDVPWESAAPADKAGKVRPAAPPPSPEEPTAEAAASWPEGEPELAFDAFGPPFETGVLDFLNDLEPEPPKKKRPSN